MEYNTINPNMATKNKNMPKPQQQQVQATPDKSIPKFCTGINFTLINNKYIAISLTYHEGNSTPVLIERVMIDIDHAQKTSDVLTDMLSKINEINKT